VDVGLNPDDIVRPNGFGFGFDQADSVFASVINQGSQFIHFATWQFHPERGTLE
jgi:hypothetical protein